MNVDDDDDDDDKYDVDWWMMVTIVIKIVIIGLWTSLHVLKHQQKKVCEIN